MQTTFVKQSLFLLILAWTIILASAVAIYLWSNQQKTIETVEIRAKTILERDMLYRHWTLQTGGLYAWTGRVQPNPKLDFLPYRDIPSPPYGTLTLVTPAHMLRQVFAISNRDSENLSRLTSLTNVSARSPADEWETKALRQFENGVREVTEVALLNGKRYVRTMRPLIAEQTCIKCHGDQGFELGSVIGGIGTSVPLEPALEAAKRYEASVVAVLSLLWLLGLSGILLQGRRLVRQTVVSMENARLRDQAEMNLHYLSNYDRHTNMPNRYLFEERLEIILKSIDVMSGRISVVALEITNLQRVIDIHGESIGRDFLKMSAERLAQELDEDDLVARLGTGRLIFTMIERDARSGQIKDLNSILAKLSQVIEHEGRSFFPMIVMGVSCAPTDSSDATDLVQMATSTLERTKEKGNSNSFEYYSKSLQMEALERFTIETGLQVALTEDQFFLQFQPQIDAIRNDIIGFEALLRWRRSDGQVIPPDKFIPVAEENGLILPIGAWVIKAACRQSVAFQQKTGRYLRTSVNVSAKQFRDPFLVDHIEKALTQTGLPPEFFEVEITENTFMDDPLKTVEILTDLKVRGIKIAIDDFGTGFSSLNYLKRFPVDRLKIDRSFVNDVVTDEDDRVLVSLVTNMARGLGLEVIAEGVETSQQRDVLLNLDCSQMQGYYYSRPLSAEDFLDYCSK